MEQTLSIIKPDAVKKGVIGKIIDRFESNGLRIAAMKKIQLDDIERYQAVKNPWYYLLGIRYTPRGWLFAVSGYSAVELEMKSGKYYRIGTDEPEKLIKALDRAMDAE